MELTIKSQHLEKMADAGSPEEAAQFFLGVVSKGLAGLIAKALDDTVKTVASSDTLKTSANAAQIDGWQKLIGGCLIDMSWDRPPSFGSITTQCIFAPRNPGDLAVLGVDIGVGISVGVHF